MELGGRIKVRVFSYGFDVFATTDWFGRHGDTSRRFWVMTFFLEGFEVLEILGIRNIRRLSYWTKFWLVIFTYE